jgi:methylamine dehydrogenase heavy chain
MFLRMVLILGLLWSYGTTNAQWDSITGGTTTVPETNAHWFSLRGGNTAYLVDGDAGVVKGTLALSRFSPAISSHISEDKIYSYGSFYSRDVYGDRTDLVMIYDVPTASPIGEIELPPKSAGIGHSGMIGLIKEKFIGVWNITPAMSVSLANIQSNEFVREIATPGCAAVYPTADGFLMPCGDGTVQYIALSDDGEETDRTRSRIFFDVMVDPVYDYAVSAGDGWMFVSLEGLVYEVTVEAGQVVVSEPWTINVVSDGLADINGVKRTNDDDWRIGGRQPFAYNAATGLFMAVMKKGGGQELFEKPGTEVWAFNMNTKRRGYRLQMEGEDTVSSVQLTPDADPLLVIATSDGITIHEARTGRKLRSMNLSGNLIQNLH